MLIPPRPRPRRGAQTARGRETRAAILKAARKMCTEQWLDQLSLAELAREAGTTRASVLFQFPDGWPDIAAELLIEEMQLAAQAAGQQVAARAEPEERLRRSLHYILERGEELGALLPNVRAFNYFWGDTLEAMVAPSREQATNEVGRLLRDTAPGRQTVPESRDAAELLFFYALDLMCAPMFRRLTSEERAAKLDHAIDLVVKGLTPPGMRAAPSSAAPTARPTRARRAR